jgi:hypothetical protein
MRTVIAVIIGCTLILSGTAAAAQRESDTKRTAALRLVKGKPLVVRGARFHAGEHVRLTARSGEETRRGVARAGRAGAFVETFNMAFDRCNGLFVIAVGNEGSRARLKLPATYCPPAP